MIRRHVSKRALLLVFLLACLCSCHSVKSEKHVPRAENGLLDLRGWDFETAGPVFLNGEWRFFWEENRCESGGQTDASPSKGDSIVVPGAWNNRTVQSTPVPGHGYATYKLKVLLPSNTGSLAFKVLDTATAFDLYVNHRKRISSGTPGTTRETSRPAYRPCIVTFEPSGNALEIALFVSNFHHRQGGMWEPILLGAAGHVEDIRNRAFMVDFLLFGSILIMGLYHLGLYYLRRTDPSPLFFGLFCLLVLIRMLTTGERYLVTLFPNLEWEVLVKLIYLSFYLSVPCFALFAKALFPRNIHSRVVLAVTCASAGLSLLVLITPARIYSYSMPFFQAFVLLAFLYGIAVMLGSAAQRREGALIFLAGFLFLFATALNDVLYTRQLIQTGHYFPFGLFAFILSQSFLLSARFSKAFKLVEEQGRRLIQSEQKYRALFEDSLEALNLTQHGKIVDANPAWLRLHGYEKEEVLGSDILRFIHPDDHALLKKRRQTWPNHQERIIQVKDIRKDGSALDVEVYSSRIILEGELFILATVRDITPEKQAEEQRRKLEMDLMRAQKMEAIGTVAGGVAHDLNNILSGIVSYPDLLLMQIPEDSPLRKPIQVMQQTGKKAAAIVQDLLTLTRRGVPVEEIVNLNDLIEEYLRSPEHGKLLTYHPLVAVETRLGEDLMNTQGSPLHLSKTIMNLVSNAAEAMPHGGRILIETENRSIARPIYGYEEIPEGEYVTVSVSDTGVGIQQEDFEKMFEPFYTKKVMGRSGTGLGMAVVWGAVKDHRGYVDVKSAPGEGTTLTLYLPATKEQAPSQRSADVSKAHHAKGETILIVDDSEEQRLIAASLLRELGYSVTICASGEEAVACIRENPVDLVLLDMIMDPGMDGLETYRRILAIRPEQRALIASGFSETDRVREAQRLGAGGYIKKPYTLDTIGQAIRAELNRKQDG